MLKEFANEISNAMNGGLAPKWFDCGVGLCSNLSNYMDYKDLNFTTERKHLRSKFNSLIDIHREYDEEQYPFNINAASYLQDVEEGIVYENKYRLAFIEELKNES